MRTIHVAVIALALIALSSQVECGFADLPKCRATFRILESQSDNGARHSPLLDVFDKANRSVGGVPIPGKELRFHNDIFPACYANQTALVIKPALKLGFQQGHCIETYAPFVSFECYFSWVLPKGTIASQGPLIFATGLGTLAITGGTGAYLGAKGQISMVIGNALNCEVGEATVNTYTFCMV